MSHILPVFEVDVSNFALLNYRIPAERLAEHLPRHYDLQTFDGDCFVSATCFCNGGFRPYGLGIPRFTFNESTFRTYVTHNGRLGVYFFGRYLDGAVPPLAQRCLAMHTYKADFDILTSAGGKGFERYTCTATSANGDVAFSLAATNRPAAREPFASGEEMAQFFTYRPHGFFTTSAGVQGQMPVSHPRMAPFEGEFSSARLDLFTQMGILEPDEVGHPHSVLVDPGVRFRLYAPRPLMP